MPRPESRAIDDGYITIKPDESSYPPSDAPPRPAADDDEDASMASILAIPPGR